MARAPIQTMTFINTKMQTTPRSNGIEEFGYVYPDGKQLPPEYLIRVTSIANKCTVIAPIQEPIQIESTSRWDEFIPTVAGGLPDILTRFASGDRHSLITRATSRRMWMGSSPMKLKIHMKFQAIRDANIEVTQAVQKLMSMALPRDGSKSGANENGGLRDIAEGIKGTNWKQIKKGLGELPFLAPPGPSPFSDPGLFGPSTFKDSVAKLQNDYFSGGDVIVVEWGRLLTFFNVIVSSVIPSIPAMPTSGGDPVKAEVDMMFETYEMMTVEALNQVFAKDQWADVAKGYNFNDVKTTNIPIDKDVILGGNTVIDMISYSW